MKFSPKLNSAKRKVVFFIIVCSIILLILIGSYSYFFRRRWTLNFYNNGKDNYPTFVLQNEYRRLTECIQVGLVYSEKSENDKAMFTCGLNCKSDESGQICDRICYKDGRCRE